MKKILFITNGHGEDVVAAQIITRLKGKRHNIEVMPVVGNGSQFKGLKIDLIGPKKILPSGGFGLRNYSYLVRDIFAGFLGKVMTQMRTLKRHKGRYDLVIGIGDIVPIIYAMITGSKFIFVGVNKSEYYKKLAFNYTGLEKWLLKNYCALTFTRDRKTCEELKLLGIHAKYVGNPMMDAVQNIRASGHQDIRTIKTIGFLPGTRDDAYKNIEDFYKIAFQINRLDKNIRFLFSVPSNLHRSKLQRIKPPLKIALTADFSEVLKASDMIIGLSGTGNEQAAGLGIPVIAFPGRGAQFNSRFASGQKELLGRALLLLSRDSWTIAKEAIALLKNRVEMRIMSLAGKQRMGGAGATAKLAEAIIKELGK